MSLRLRLTLLYSAILALTLIGFSVVLYLTVANVSRNVLAQSLEFEAERLIETRRSAPRVIQVSHQQFATVETFKQTCNKAGAVLDRTPNLSSVNMALPLTPVGLEAVQRGEEWVETARIEGREILTHSEPFFVRGQVAGFVQVGRSFDDQEQALATLRQALVMGSGVAIVIALVLGWALAGVGLRPLTRITQTAQAIGAAHDFTQRVAHTGPPDEVGRLATTFNTMLTELQSAYQQVEQTLQAQRRFIADASHELRTPLTTIRGNLALFRRDPPISADDRVAALSDTVDESERMMRLVNDLLLLARTDAGRPLRSEPVALAPLIADACRKARVLAPDRSITYTAPCNFTIRGDPDALQQVLLILLDNAIKFTAPGGLITITAMATTGQVALSVHDTGVGIAPAALPHIFERFYRGNMARNSAGNGLGLAIAKALIESQQGTITVESKVGRGSVFTVTLPQVV